MKGYAGAKASHNAAVVNTLLYGAIAGLAMGIAALTVYLLHDQLREPADSPGGSLSHPHDGIIAIEPPLALPDFTLDNHHGGATSLSDLRGGFTLLAFGFLHCPDICPMTLNEMQRLRDMLGEAAAAAQFVFISVDGARDTPEALDHYFEFRDMRDMLGLTGAEATVRKAGDILGLSFAVSAEAATSGYLVDHTAGTFLLDERGRWIRRYHFGVPARAIADDMLRIING
ncbi:MAG: SCO family protein [Chloroflexi bacterium]|nr:SCO family protein [Chloroflexota bacterium]MCY3583985.1 SCO family protein [Chloroflexota bacterium]MCY3716679.1 SCO family protein [Chloroflexota bacterium]MDE2649373.1 SCO family protein [Chloroflexota bacterium]MXX51178.1 SCO family protein [Chloroflexota bacterium]